MRPPYLLILLLAVKFASGQVFVRIGASETVDEDDDDDDVVQEVQQPVIKGRKNPCYEKRCGRGEECTIENDKAKCICIRDCPDELDARFKVCSVRNETFSSECHLDRQKCLCKKGDSSCQHSSHKKLRLDYYGACKELTACEDWEYEQFPGRMRNWTFVVMKEMARRNELGDYIPMLKNARADDLHTDAVIWKFCDLDVHPQDRHVSRRELLMIIATIKPLEHCLVPFLNKCDADADHTITLREWGVCLGLVDHKEKDKQNHDVVDAVLIDKCAAIHKRQKRT